MTDDNLSLSDQWLRAGISRHRGALGDAHEPHDRLALLRSIARLSHGRLDLSLLNVVLSEDESAGLTRHGLAIDGNVLRLLDERQDHLAPDGFWEAEALDAGSRRPYAAASPDAVLLRHTTHTAYRMAAQKAAVRALLTMPAGGGLMVSMPTGSGKSLLFQLDALVRRASEPGSTVLVITPTVSLALDHARTMRSMRGLSASRALIGDVLGADRVALLNDFRRGGVPILLMSPEIALGSAREHLLEAATAPEHKPRTLSARLTTLVIDEAHIVESWGRGFRPNFQRLPALLRELRQRNPNLNVVLLSATLPPAARKVLREAYSPGGPWLEVDAAAPRYEHDLVVQSYDDAETRQAALDFVIDRAPRPLIVYTTLAGEKDVPGDERLSAAALYRHLRERGYGRIALFTGDVTDTAERRCIVEDWAADRLDIVVATSAFGMGVDKADVRTVVHACLPEGPARWYQEIGRAARDGHQGLAVCLFIRDIPSRSNDVSTAFSQATTSWLTRPIAEARWRALFERRSNVRWPETRMHLRLDLDAARDGLPSGSSSDYNRGWNMNLLNLMQRARVLQVLSVDDAGGGAFWDIELTDPTILERDSTALWDRIFTRRDEEQGIARAEVNAFQRLVTRPQDQCLLAGVFELLEEQTSHAFASCGRCPYCRAHRMRPPEALRCGGLDASWPAHFSGDELRVLPAGTLIVLPDDPTGQTGVGRLVERLARLGIEQYVVADRDAGAVASILALLPVAAGFVIGHAELFDDPHATLSALPTAVFLPLDQRAAERLWLRCRDWMAALPQLPFIVVGRGDLEIAGRRLQVFSNLAPYAEESLDAFAEQAEMSS